MKNILIFTTLLLGSCTIKTPYYNEDKERIIINFKEIIIFLIVIYLILVAEKLYKDKKKK